MELNSAQVLQILRDNLYGNNDKMVIDRDTTLSMFNCIKDLTNRAIRFECELATARDDRYREGLRHSKTVTEFRNALRKHVCDCEEPCGMGRRSEAVGFPPKEKWEADIYCGWEAKQIVARYE
jgi:hypothetical protein